MPAALLPPRVGTPGRPGREIGRCQRDAGAPSGVSGTMPKPCVEQVFFVFFVFLFFCIPGKIAEELLGFWTLPP